MLTKSDKGVPPVLIGEGAGAGDVARPCAVGRRRSRGQVSAPCSSGGCARRLKWRKRALSFGRLPILLPCWLMPGDQVFIHRHNAGTNASYTCSKLRGRERYSLRAESGFSKLAKRKKIENHDGSGMETGSASVLCTPYGRIVGIEGPEHKKRKIA